MTNLSLDEDTLTQAYVYGFPLVFNLEQVKRLVTEGIGAMPSAPFNSFAHARTLAGPSDTFVTINNDTVYSMAAVDLSVGPLRLHVPDAGGRYYVLQFIDAWTDNFAYIGHRATGTEAADYLLVPSEWTGDAPQDVTVIRFPTTVASIVGRWAVSSEDDLPAVHALQDEMTLAALDSSRVPVGLAEPDPSVPRDVLFWEKLRVWSQQFPPAPRDAALQESFAPIGIAEREESPYRNLSDQDHAALAAGITAGERAIEQALHASSSPVVNGWTLTYHVFDYNLDYFEVGTIEDERFMLTDPRVRIVERAGAAKAGLWGNHAYEAAYIMTYVDDQGEQLSGAHSYTLRFDPLPPVGAFWSVTMYSSPDFFLVDNPIDRYSIGDRTPGIIFDDDGALTISISHEPPTDETAHANWLPAPGGLFRPVLRMYEPDAEVLDGEYTVPAIRRR